jgi:Leucine Rich repeats (2 copies)
MSTEALKLEIPKLPELDKEDVKAIRSFLPGKLLGRTAAFLSLVLLVLGFVIAIKVSLHQFPDLELAIPTWAYGILFGLCFLSVVAQVVLEWRAERNRAALQALAVKIGAEQAGYFRIGPYQDAAEDRAKFSRPDHAEQKVLEWLKKSTQVPLYLTGDSGSGKSSLLNAFVLPKLREAEWTVVEARAWQDPQAALRDALRRLPGMRRPKAGEDRTLREIVDEAVKRAADRLLIVLDQFEEFVIVAEPERQREFAAFVDELQTRPVKGLTLLLVLRSDYQMLLEEIGLPLLRSGENLLQVARFQLSAANTFMKQSGLDLQPEALDHLLTSAAELDDTPGLVRPITLNVIGYVLASGKTMAPSLDAVMLVRQYIEQTLEQPAIRDRAPRMLEQMITEQGTKQPRLEQELAVKAELRLAEVRAVLNSLCDAGIARPLDPARGVWELSHDFIARAVARFLGRRRHRVLRRAGTYAAPVLLAVSLFIAVGVSAWNRFSPDHIRGQLADLGFVTRTEFGALTARAAAPLDEVNLPAIVPLLGSLVVRSLDLSGTQVASVDALKGLTALQRLDLTGTPVASVDALKGLTGLQWLYLSDTKVASVDALKELTALQLLRLTGTQVASVDALKGLTALRSLNLTKTQVASVDALKGLTALQTLDLSDTKVASVDALKELTALRSLDLTRTQIASVDALKGLTALWSLDLSGTRVASVDALKGLTALRVIGLSTR